MSINRRILTDLGVASADVDKYLPDLVKLMPQYEIDNKLRVAHFLAQVLHESTNMKRAEENLNYSEKGLLKVFGKYFTPEMAKTYARKSEKIANRVYANRMGNGDESSGDGYRYHGRGLIQLTGKENYRNFSDWIQVDVVAKPELVASRFAVHSAVYYWTARNLNRYADQDDIIKITKAINGGLNGLADRNAILDEAKRLLVNALVQQALPQSTHLVTATSLNLRNRPQVSATTRICALPQGTRVSVLENLIGNWSKVQVNLNEKIIEGFVASKYLDPLPELQHIELRAAKLEHPTHVVTASKLNFRNQPSISASTKIDSLDQGTKIEKLADEPGGWFIIRVVVGGKIKQGYVASRYLLPLTDAGAESIELADDVLTESHIPSVHLQENRPDITRQRDGGRAYPLGEADRPDRTGEDSSNRIKALLQIIQYLDSENTQHRRYQPKANTTFCNIYAYDFCYLAGVYLPRVWWTDKALLKLQDDLQVPVLYGKTVREMNANMLLDWLDDYGHQFAWKRVFDLDLLQACANNGEVCIIVAQRKHLNQSGHIAIVAPETEQCIAARNSAGKVLRPVESQAGRKNHRLVVKPTKWWLASTFRNHGFWRHL